MWKDHGISVTAAPCARQHTHLNQIHAVRTGIHFSPQSPRPRPAHQRPQQHEDQRPQPNDTNQRIIRPPKGRVAQKDAPKEEQDAHLDGAIA